MAISIFMFHIPRIGSCETQLDELLFLCVSPRAQKARAPLWSGDLLGRDCPEKTSDCDWSLERAIRNQLSDINDQATSGSSGKTRELFTLIADEEFFSIVIAVEAFN